MLYIHVSLHSEPPEVGLVEKLTGRLYWWVELCVLESATALSNYILEKKCSSLLLGGASGFPYTVQSSIYNLTMQYKIYY